MSVTPIAVVGIGADGWAGLGEPARAAILAADTIVGSRRQLDLLPATAGARRPWPSPIDPLVDELADGVPGTVCVLASGDPMLHGIGATLARRVGPERLAVHPHPSAFSLACARLGWPAAETELVSAVGRPPEVAAALLQPGRRLIAYVTGAAGAAGIARVLRERGFGPSRFVVLEALGAPPERIVDGTPDDWGDAEAGALHAVAVECRAAPGALVLPRTPGLPDAAYESDGQLTKRAVRAVTLAALGPGPRRLLWDVGAGSGSVAIEWLRAEPTARAVAIEPRADRAARIAANARRLGVPALEVRAGAAPGALHGLDRPDAVFVGGGVSVAGLLDRCWDALAPGGRIVANAVTLEGEQALHAARAAHGGALMRLAVSHAEPLGGLEAWRPQLPVVQWSADKEGA
ncbi:MAG: precorrin-6B C5,15-methyltransferase / cobalt-precorrin-6B C5,C15-methyltransferase [Solirubrobacteraceae bacterium]|nr:precorrin-6B C5,15-methyltransferase / cobalt-precorrin-6B C5,C15-methyltransferase [Solirubrobacteraceae bacterium]